MSRLEEDRALRNLMANRVAAACRDTYLYREGPWLYQTRRYSFIYNGPADLSGSYTPPGP